MRPPNSARDAKSCEAQDVFPCFRSSLCWQSKAFRPSSLVFAEASTWPVSFWPPFTADSLCVTNCEFFSSFSHLETWKTSKICSVFEAQKQSQQMDQKKGCKICLLIRSYQCIQTNVVGATKNGPMWCSLCKICSQRLSRVKRLKEECISKNCKQQRALRKQNSSQLCHCPPCHPKLQSIVLEERVRGHVVVTCMFKSHSNCYCWMDLLKHCQLYCNYISVPKMATAKVRSEGCSKRGPTFAP